MKSAQAWQMSAPIVWDGINDWISAIQSDAQQGWLSPDEAKEKEKLSKLDGLEIVRLNNEAKRLEAECAAMRQLLKDIAKDTRFSIDVITGRLGPERDGPWVTVDHRRINDVLSTTAGTDLLAKLERYEKALKTIDAQRDSCAVHRIAREALKGESK